MSGQRMTNPKLRRWVACLDQNEAFAREMLRVAEQMQILGVPEAAARLAESRQWLAAIAADRQQAQHLIDFARAGRVSPTRIH